MDGNRQHEIDRLRLLLQKATGARKALMVELEASSTGFRIITTGVSAEHEMIAAQQIADYVNILLKGAVRFTVAALDEYSEDRWKADADGVLDATVQAISGTPDLTPVPEPKPKAFEPEHAVVGDGGLTRKDDDA